MLFKPVCFHQWSWKVSYKRGSIEKKKTRKMWFQITRDIASSVTSQNMFSQTGKGYKP